MFVSLCRFFPEFLRIVMKYIHAFCVVFGSIPLEGDRFFWSPEPSPVPFVSFPFGSFPFLSLPFFLPFLCRFFAVFFPRFHVSPLVCTHTHAHTQHTQITQQTHAEKWGDGSHRGRKVSQWTDEAVDQLLDRSVVEGQDPASPSSQPGEGGSGEGSASNALGSLLQTFKVIGHGRVG